MKNFYGVFGVNGLAVYDNWARVEKNRKFLKTCQYKGFETFDDAEEFAVENYLAINSSLLREMIPKKLPINYMIFSSQLYPKFNQ